MNTSQATATKTCTSYQDLFQHPALDYEPHDEAYAELTTEQRADLRATKTQVEQDCKQVCFDCPLLMGCAKKYLTTNVSGVVGGLTLTERRAARKAHELTLEDDNAMIERLVSGRGPRRRIDTDAVASMTAEGKSAEEIGYHFACNPRTVVRARSRARTQAAVGVPQPPVAPREVTSNDVGLLLAAAQETVNAAARTSAPRPTPVARVLTAVATTPAPTPTPVTKAATPTRLRTIRLAKTSPAMIAMLTVLQDGRWHDQGTLITIGAAHVDDDEAIQWWYRANSTPSTGGLRTLNPGRAQTPTAERVALGARSKVANMLSASARTRHQTERNQSHQYRFTATGATAWATANTRTGTNVALPSLELAGVAA